VIHPDSAVPTCSRPVMASPLGTFLEKDESG
jgi:hypothetical protein